MFDVEKELHFNEEGEAVIECKIGETENIFSRYDILQDRTIDDSFDQYLLEETAIIPIQHDLEVKMHITENCNEDTKIQIRKAIKRHYSFNLTKAKVELQKNRLLYLFLYFLGVVALFLTPFANKVQTTLPIYELLLIIVWFCFWEASNIALFKCSELKHKQINMFRLYNAKITFIKNEKLKPNTTVIAGNATIITDKANVKSSKKTIK